MVARMRSVALVVLAGAGFQIPPLPGAVGPVRTDVYSVGLISEAKSLPEGSEVILPTKPVTRNFGDHFYIEERSRASGIRVIGTTAASTGRAVNVRGILSTVNGERVITANSIGVPVVMPALKPVGLDPSEIDREGLSTVGLLVRTAGEVTGKAEGWPPQWFTISDYDRTLRVWNKPGALVELGDFVCLTAAHSRYAGTSGNSPLLELAGMDDFANLSTPPAELVSRGDFECSWSEFASAFWIEGPAPNVSLDSSVKWRGSKSLKVTNDSTTANVFANQDVPFACTSAPRRIRISMMWKAQSVVRGAYPWYGVRGIVWLLDGAGAVVSACPAVYDLTEFPTGTFDWQYYGRTLVIPVGVAKLRLQLGLNGASGTVWFDDVRAIEVFDDYLAAEDASVNVTVDPAAVVSTPCEGIGWNWETVSPGRYASNELAIWSDLFNKMSWDGPDWLRVGITTSMCPPLEYVRGGDTGQHYTHNFNTLQVSKLCDLLSICEARRIHVSLANWNAGQAEYDGVPNGQWLVKGYYDATGSTAPDWWTPYSNDRMAECLTELLHYLRVTRGFTCIKYLSIWNEPGGPWTDIGRYPAGFMQIYDLLDAKLKAKGIRDLVRLEGNDSVEAGDSAQMTVDAIRDHGGVIDVAAVHDYSYGLEVATATTSSWHLRKWVEDYGPVLQQLNTMRAQPIPLFITETSGMGTCEVFTQRGHYLISLSAAEDVIEMLRIGAAGVLRWQYNDPGPTQYEPFTAAGSMAVPNREIYYPWCVLTRWTVKNSNVLATQLAGGLDAAGKQRVHAVALRAPNGCITVLLTNNGRLAKAVRLDLGSAASGTWRHFYYDATLPTGVCEATVPAVSGSLLTATVLPESVNAFTTFPVGLSGASPR